MVFINLQGDVLQDWEVEENKERIFFWGVPYWGAPGISEVTQSRLPPSPGLTPPNSCPAYSLSSWPLPGKSKLEHQLGFLHSSPGHFRWKISSTVMHPWVQFWPGHHSQWVCSLSRGPWRWLLAVLWGWTQTPCYSVVRGLASVWSRDGRDYEWGSLWLAIMTDVQCQRRPLSREQHHHLPAPHPCSNLHAGGEPTRERGEGSYFHGWVLGDGDSDGLATSGVSPLSGRACQGSLAPEQECRTVLGKLEHAREWGPGMCPPDKTPGETRVAGLCTTLGIAGPYVENVVWDHSMRW